jgi:PleD family two-component response regulator
VTIRVLIAESEPEDLLFLQDVVEDIASQSDWGRRVSLEATLASSLAEAEAILSSRDQPHSHVSLVLLASHLPDGDGPEGFRRLERIAPEVPVIMLIQPHSDPQQAAAQQDMAAQLIREGAQDFLIASEIDCHPLAHAMRTAIERHRLRTATRAAVTMDPITGLLNHQGFLAAAEHDRNVAERLGLRSVVLIAHRPDLAEFAAAFGEQQSQLILTGIADRLREISQPTDLLGKGVDEQFFLAFSELEPASLERRCQQIRDVAATHRIAVSWAMSDPAQPLRAASIETLLEQAQRDLGVRSETFAPRFLTAHS